VLAAVAAPLYVRDVGSALAVAPIVVLPAVAAYALSDPAADTPP
jgi:hypothetical protein